MVLPFSPLISFGTKILAPSCGYTISNAACVSLRQPLKKEAMFYNPHGAACNKTP
jgi:hypothetical protein